MSAQVSPTPKEYETATLDYSGSGDVTGPIIPTNDIVIPPTPTPSSTSGCEASDFVAAPSGPAIALIQRGTCTLEIKVANAEAAGYDAVLFFNEGQPGRTDLPAVTVGAPADVPVNGLTFADGAELYAAAQAGAVTGRVFASVEVNLEAKTVNVIADSPKGKKANEVVVVGAHLDSVVEGPGINDNGSGSATILEIAQEMAELKSFNKMQRKVRFAFWGAEESGTLGSEYYVDNLSDAQLRNIYANLNFDMLGSPNYVRFVYDGDGSASDRPDRRGRMPSRRSSPTTSPAKDWPVRRRSSVADRTMAHSSRPVFPPVVYSVVLRASRPRKRLRSTAARPGSGTTRATTRRATTSTT